MIHLCPPVGSGFTPCCGRTVLELPRDDRITLDSDLVDCTLNKRPVIDPAMLILGDYSD